MLVYHSENLVHIRYTNLNFQGIMDTQRSIFSNVFTLGDGVVSWRIVKQSCVANSL